MIVSASYRTDIPAFYADWFRARLAAGWCRVANPYGGPAATVRLDAADGFVFWTRNAAPFAAALDEVAARGIPFVVQFTVTGYPRSIDAATVQADRAVAQLRALAGRFGPRAVVWRYDPIVATGATPPAWHVDNFARLAAALAGATDEAVVSFAQLYRKTRRNLGAAAARGGFAVDDPPDAAKRDLLSALVPVAAAHGMALTVCTQPGLMAPGAAPARCIDADRLSAVAGRPVAARLKGNRPGCGCHESRDIGAYDTCPHGCAYCYAVQSRDKAQAALKAHDPAAERLG
ncbi:MAG: DUF1848 domain-containing protein [Rhodospirillales bacterium]